MPTLYHMPVALCAQKVRVCLAEKGVQWESQDATGRLRDPEYLALNPGGYVPTLVHDGKIITESRVISEYIDEAFGGPSLQSNDTYERTVMRRWTKQIDEVLHPFIFILSFVPFFRERFVNMSEEDRNMNLPFDPIKADRARSLLEQGWESPLLPMAVKRFEKLVISMEEALQRSGWLAGDDYSLADADYTPYLQRMEDIGLSWLWTDKPAVTNWYTRVRSRPSYAAVVDDWVSPADRQAVAKTTEQIAPKYKQIFDKANAAVQ